MMKFKNILLPALTLAFLVSSCGLTELDLLNDPSEVTADNVDINLLYNNVVKEFADFVDEASDETMPYVRMTAMAGGFQYNNQDSPGSFNFIWEQAYNTLLPDINLVIDLAAERGFTVHSGSAKILKAYVFFSLVDLFGDVPFSEALQGISNPSPKADDDESVYTAALALLDEGINDLANPVSPPPFDPYYDGDAAGWIKLANSLKLRYHVQTRLVGGSASEINALLDKVIDSSGDDFEFPYGLDRQTSDDIPDSRHPYYQDGYEVGGPGLYMSNYMMWEMFLGKAVVDPRIRYYFRRQDAFEDNENQFTLECQAAPYPLHWPDGYPWCTASGDFTDLANEWGGYWGRNHGDASGIPPDDLKRTAWGLYPGGGAFDNLPAIVVDEDPESDDFQVSNAGADGARGAGIQPILLASYVHFLRAEAALTMGTNDDARVQLEAAVKASIDKVMNFNTAVVDAAFVPSDDDVDAYVAEVLGAYDAADDDGKLNVIIGEFRLALHGMGLDAYNAYRRTSKPEGMELTFQANPGTFPRTMWYPADYVNRNANATQRPGPELDTRVFWDTNPDDLQ
ncbi:MAG: SusD/RagB family nutrient-binding outer membrane lipoprotein [Bacteroidota bacterium]